LIACNGSSEDTNSEELRDEMDTLSTEGDPFEWHFDPNSITDSADLTGIEFKGELKSSVRFADSRGEHILVNSVEYWQGNYDFWNADLYSAHYLRTDSGLVLLRLVSDFVRECEFDITLEFVGTPSITDANADDIAEVAVCYKMACRSDVSECDMKVIMHDGDDKFGLRGLQMIIFAGEHYPENFTYNLEEITEDEVMGSWNTYLGRYVNNDDFNNAPVGYFEIADSIWRSAAFVDYRNMGGE
jgi:hypothetical protein